MSIPVRCEQIVRQVADAVCKRICWRTIRACRKIEPALFGDDPVLGNAWEDICAQEQQADRSLVWDETYGATLRAIIEGELGKLDEATRWAIWHQTDAGCDWSVDEAARAEKCTDDDLAQFILDEYVLRAAESYSNARIRRYLDRAE